MKTQCLKTRTLLAGAAFLALAASPLARADYQSTVVSQSPAGYWRLNETVQPQNSTVAANIGSLGASANGIYMNYASGGLPGPFAGSTAVSLDGASQYVSTPWVAGLNGNPFSVEVWANLAQVPKFGYILSSGDMASPRAGWYLAQDDGSTFNVGSAFVVRFFNQNTTTPSIQYSAPVTNAAGTWVHLVLTYNGSVGALYMNGVLITNAPAAYVAPLSAPFTVGCRSSISQFWPGKAAEVAMYNTALSAGRVAAHYTAGMTAPASYQATVLADSPVCYQRYQEAGAPPAANLGTLGAAGNGAYIYDATAGVSGPTSPTYAGFEAANKATSFSGTGPGVVRIPALNLNTNAVTISGWFKPNGSQPLGAGLVLNGAGASASGLTIDRIDGGLSLGYVWSGNDYSIAWNRDLGLPLLQDLDWNYVALVVEPTKATIYVCDATKFENFASAQNTFNVNHANQAFSATTLIAAESGSIVKNFKGVADEVAIFKRALSAGELYTQYATAVGGVPPKIFANLQGPTEPVILGDPVLLSIDVGGTPALSYEWHRDGTNYATTTVGVLAIPTVAEGNSSYDVTVSNGSGSVQSQTVYANVITPTIPVIVGSEGFQNRTLYPRATLRLSVTATGGGLKYQWYKNSTAIAAATASTYTIVSVTNSDVGSYAVAVTNTMGRASNGPVVITIPTYATNSYEAAIVASRPQGWWRLAEPVGSTYLVDGMGRHDGYYTNGNGTVPPVTLGVTGALIGNPNTAASISPTYKGVGVVPYSPALIPDQFTVEIWARTPLASSTLYALSSSWTNGGWYWRTTGGYWNGNNAPIQDNGATTAAVVPGAWTHLVFTYDVTRGTAPHPYQYFVNGQGDDGYIWTGPVRGTGPMFIGGRGVNEGTFPDGLFDGQTDEVAIYPRVLPLSEIQAHYAARGTEILPPTFTTPLLSQTVTTGKSISFTTTVLGTAPIGLYWYKGTPQATAPIATGTNAFWINPTTLADSGTYSIVASNAAGMVTNTASLTVISPVGYANVTNNLVLHLRFDGNSADSSGRGNNGTPSSSPAPAFVPGIIGAQASEFTTTSVTNNGTNIAFSSGSHVKLGAVPSGPPSDLQFGATTSFSVSLWVKLPAGGLPGDLPFIGTATNAANNPGWVLCPTYNTGGWQWCLGDGTSTLDVNGAGGSINDGGWHSFVLTVDRSGSFAKSYLDGVLMASRSISSLGSFDNNNYWPLAIGQDPTGGYPVINGASATDFAAWIPPNIVTLDDIGIWRRALTPLEVAQVASAGSTAGRSFDTVAPASVTITISKSGSSMTLNWSAGTLLQSDTLGASAVWTPVVGATAPSYTFTPGATNKFYRVLVQ